METNWAAENLQTIRTLMERSALYRRALAPIMILSGLIGTAAGILGWLLKIQSGRGFISYWVGVAIAALCGSFILARRQAIKDAEPFWSPPTKRVAEAFIPAFSVGALFTAACWYASDPGSMNWAIIVMAWSWLYGCAFYTAGFFMPGRARQFGWPFLVAGSLLLCCVLDPEYVYAHEISPNLVMAIIFGGAHLTYGFYLYATGARRNES